MTEPLGHVGLVMPRLIFDWTDDASCTCVSGNKGVRELNSTGLWATADLRGYRTDKNTFYLLKFWRAFPSEDPTATPHLKTSARGQSIMWRGLRPELVRSNPVPLSPDANLLVTHDAPDWRQQRDDVLEATRRLVNEVCSINHTKSFQGEFET